MALILVVDDDLPSVELMKFVLKRAGYEVMTSHTGADVLDIATYHRPELIILNDGLPVMRGSEISRIIKSNPVTAHIPIILWSAGMRVRDPRYLREIGADAGLPKPVLQAEILRTVPLLKKL